jgi:hypothetical protein
MPSLGLTGAAIPGIRYGAPRLVRGLVSDLFREDADQHYRDLLAYSVRELETLESPAAWIERLTAEAISACQPIDEFDQLVLAEAAQAQAPN